MDQPRTDEDQQLVARTAGWRCRCVRPAGGEIHPAPLRAGLQHDLESRDTNDLLQDIFSKAYKSIRGFRGKSSFYTWIHSIAVNMTLNFLRNAAAVFTSVWTMWTSVQNDKEFSRAHPDQQSGAGGRPVRAPAKDCNEAMMKLSDEHRAVVTMFHFRECPMLR